jgi:hypothetical protein
LERDPIEVVGRQVLNDLFCGDWLSHGTPFR